jgi:succinylglutamic semialdehyde dehydrogenase
MDTAASQNLRQRLDMRQFPVAWPGHYLASGWHHSGKIEDTGARRHSSNPNTGEELVATTTEREAKATLDKAIDQAERARLSLRTLPVDARIDELRMFRRALGDFSRDMMLALRLESGMTPAEADMDLAAASRHLDYVLDNAGAIEDALLAPARLGVESPGRKQEFALLPVGITIGYLPFSNPLSTLATNVSAALLAGCPLIIMPSPHCSLVGILLGHLIEELSLTRGALQVVFGNFEVLRHALNNNHVAAVLYNGSREHCQRIRSESRAVIERQLVLQSGGKNAVVIHESADIPDAVRITMAGALRGAGQLCTSTSRVFVHRSVSEEFCSVLEAAAASLLINRTDLPGQDDAGGRDLLAGRGMPHMGPLYAGKAVDKFLRFQTMARREAKRTISTGKKISELRGGHFVTPGIHLMKQFDPASAYQSNVIFSPDIAIYEYTELDQAIEAVNSTDAAFAMSFAGDPEIIRNWRHHLLPPNVILNGPTTEQEIQLPLAGRLQSGHHRFHGAALALYLSYPQVIHSHGQAMDEYIATWRKFI